MYELHEEHGIVYLFF